MTDSWGEFASTLAPPLHAMDQWDSALSYLCALTGWRWCLIQMTLEMYLIVVKKKSKTLEPCRNIIAGKQASNKKPSEAIPAFVPYNMRFIFRKETDKTTHVSKTTACTLRACAKHGPHKHTRLKIDFHSWPFHFVGKVPGKISAAYWLVKMIFEMTVGIVLTRKAVGLAKNRVRVWAQELMLAFPQHCIVSCEGGSTVFSWELTLSNPVRFRSKRMILRVKSGPTEQQGRERN